MLKKGDKVLCKMDYTNCKECQSFKKDRFYTIMEVETLGESYNLFYKE